MAQTNLSQYYYYDPETGTYWDPQTGQQVGPGAPQQQSPAQLAASVLPGAATSLFGPSQAVSAAATPGSQAAWNASALGGGDATALAADEAAASTAATNAGATTGVSGALPWLTLALLAGATGSKAIGAYDKGEGRSPLGGLKAGIKEAGWMNAVPLLGQAPWLGGLAGALFGSGKDRQQMARDQQRKTLKDAGFIDQSYQYKLPDGSMFNFGEDGKAEYSGVDGKKYHSAFELDWNAPYTQYAVGLLNPLDRLTGGTEKNSLITQLVRGSTHGANSYEDVSRNARSMYDRLGGYRSAREAITRLKDSGTIDEHEMNLLHNGLDQTYGHAPLPDFSQVPLPDNVKGRQGMNSPAPVTPKDNLDTPQSVGQYFPKTPEQQSSMVAKIAPNKYGNTRVSPGVYKDKSGRVFLSTTGR